MVLHTIRCMSKRATRSQDPKGGRRAFIQKRSLSGQAPPWYPLSVLISVGFRQFPRNTHGRSPQNVLEEEIFRRCIDLVWPSPVGVGVSSAGDPTCTIMESWEPSAAIGESDKGGSSAALSLIILVDQLVTNFSPGSSEGFPSRIQSACGH